MMLQEIIDRGYKAEGRITVSTDTRNLPEGCIFFALHGANFNGNKFAMQALETGANLVVVDEDIPATCTQNACFGKQIIRVEDTLKALQELAREWREEWSKGSKTGARKTVIGITGTNGKTTTKELTAAVLKTKYNVHYTQGNLNNQVGVPLTLLQLTDEHELAIIEMGASHPGDIRELVEIAEPDCGLITNVGKAHLQGFGSFEGVMQTKGELYEWLREHNGFCFRNLQNAYLSQMAGDLQTVGYHTGTMPSDTHLVGDYNSENVQAALCIGRYFGVDEQAAMRAIREYVPSNNRSQLMQTGKNLLVVDAYNANPTSMQAAILNFSNKYCTNRMFILGDMLELGEYSHTEHQNIVNMLLEQKEDSVLLVGKEFKNTTAPYPVFENTEELRNHIEQHPIEGKTILLKGSHGIHLETLINIL